MTVAAALVGAVGTVLSAWIAVRVRAVQTSVNGNLTELKTRVALLELVLSAEAEADQGRYGGEHDSSPGRH